MFWVCSFCYLFGIGSLGEVYLVAPLFSQADRRISQSSGAFWASFWLNLPGNLISELCNIFWWHSIVIWLVSKAFIRIFKRGRGLEPWIAESLGHLLGIKFQFENWDPIENCYTRNTVNSTKYKLWGTWPQCKNPMVWLQNPPAVGCQTENTNFFACQIKGYVLHFAQELLHSVEGLNI